MVVRATTPRAARRLGTPSSNARVRRRASSRRGAVIIFSVLLLMTFIIVLLTRGRCDTRREASSEVVWRTEAGNGMTNTIRFQVIVLTHSRASSLHRLLKSVRGADYVGDAVDLHVWVDRSENGTVDDRVLDTCREFRWPHGELSVHVWDRHVGIWGQWIDSFRPVDEKDFGILLEDDLEVSPLYYRWLVGARRAYGKRKDVFGYTLQRGTLRANQTGFGRRKIRMDSREKAYLYLLLGSWGYAPEPARWIEFRRWFHERSCEREFRPLVPGLIPTKWYVKQEAKRSMWTMWHIRYAHERRLFTVYANLDDSKTLAANWREAGLHFGKTGNVRRASSVSGKKDFELLRDGGKSRQTGGRFEYPAQPRLMEWNGTYVNRTGQRTTQ